jgi:adenylate cyclase class 2
MREIEIKFANVDPAQLENKLIEIGATRAKEFNYRMRAFDFPGLKLAEKNAWIRVRDDSDEVTLSYKERLGVTSQDASVPDEGMEEIEVIVSDFEQTSQILKSIGMIEKVHQEKQRIRYIKGDVEFDIDIWPFIPPYLEIEGPSNESIEAAAIELGFDPADAKICSASQMFKMYGFDQNDYSYMGFDKMVKREESL